MSDRTYVYAIHIATTPEQLWQALASNEFSQQYFPEWRIESDWQTGSPVTYYTADGKLYSQRVAVWSCRLELPFGVPPSGGLAEPRQPPEGGTPNFFS